MLELNHIEKRFNVGTVNETSLFHDFSLTVKTGDFISVIGSNGSGKTTVLSIISGGTPIDGGCVLLDGKDMTATPEFVRAKRIGFVNQNPALGTVPHLTALENLLLSSLKGKHFHLSPLVGREERGRMRDLVSTLGMGLEEKMDVPVGLLSGGQRQALSLLMTTLSKPDLLLLDEHTAALDPKSADRVMELTDRIVKEQSITTVMVTHNLRYATEYGNRLIMMHEGKAIVDAEGEEKNNLDVDKLLDLFYHISVENGNSV